MSNNNSLKDFALSVLSTIGTELSNDEYEHRLDPASCGNLYTNSLLSLMRIASAAQVPDNYAEEISRIAATALEKMKSEGPYASVWRRLYSDAFLVHSMIDCLSEHSSANQTWEKTVERLDMTIVVAGAPGEGRLDLILDAIQRIQEEHLPFDTRLYERQSNCSLSPIPSLDLPLASAAQPVLCLASVPSFSAFQSELHLKPFIIRNFASTWPAVSDNKWTSKAYLKNVAGEGRVVPIEIGSDYRTDDWSQEMVNWGSFLDYLFPDAETEVAQNRKLLYLAQHDLFKQFPALRGDIIVPDYVYSVLPPPEYFPQYRSPANEDGFVSNVWIGPEKTVSPAHTDPYFNFYGIRVLMHNISLLLTETLVQVVGHKTVWLAPPNISSAMSPFSEPALSTDGESSARHPALNHVNPALSNTSRIDVFAGSASDTEADNTIKEDLMLKNFRTSVVPKAMSATLGPGDMLFFPPGWWHAMRSETISFSVSLWF